MKNTYFFILLLIAGFSAYSQLTVDDLVYSHLGPTYRDAGQYSAPWGKHEGVLRGVPTGYDWANGARPGAWMNHGSNQAVTGWGQVYEMGPNSPVKNVRVQLRNFKMYVYVNNQWALVENASSNIQGAWYSEDFTSNSAGINSRDESANGGGRSFNFKEGYNVHFWDPKWPRSALPSGFQAFFIVVEARLIPDTDPNVNLSNAKYLLGVSADTYPTVESHGFGPWPSLSISRHKWVTSQWQTYCSYISGSVPTTVEGYRNNILSRPLPPGVSSGGGTVAVTGVSVSPTSTTLNVGSTQQLTATVSPSNATNKTVNWSSGNNSIATVSSSGLVTAVATGTATITVTTQDGNKTATCSVTVTESQGGSSYSQNFNTGTAPGWSLSTNLAVVNSKLNSSNWAATTRGVYDGATFASPYTYTLEINGSGSSIGNSTIILFNYQNENNHYMVEFTGGSSGVAYLKKRVNGTVSTIATSGVYQTNGTNVTVEITSASGSITVKATKSGSTTTLFNNVSDGSFTQGKIGVSTIYNNVDFDNITVTTPTVAVTGVSVSPTSVSMAAGATQQLAATVAPSNATNKTVSWSSGNTSVATVNSSGLVTAVAAGSATITVTTQDGNKTATSNITVNVPVTSVSVSPSIASIQIGATQQLTATVSPSNATNKTVTWSSGNPSVATVNSSGLVSGISAGSAIITVTTQDGNKTASCSVTVSAPPSGSSYSENFNNGTAPGWSLSANMAVINSKLTSSNWVETAWGIYDGATFSSPYTYSIDMNGSGSSTGNFTYILFNRQNENNYHMVEFTGGSSGVAYLKKRVNGTFSTIATSGTYQTNGTNVTVEITCSDGKITVKATRSGTTTTLFNNISDNTFSQGKIGASTGFNNVEFDNVTVTPLSTGVVYTENFNDNLAQDWTSVSGTWTATGNEYYNSSTNANETSIYHGSTFADYTFSVKAKPIWNNWYGVIFNYQNSSNYYYLHIKASAEIAFRKVVNGVTTTIATGTYPGGGQNVYSTVEVSNNGSTTTVKVNGATIFNSLPTTDWSFGKIGLYADWTAVYFDDVNVTALSSTKSALAESVITSVEKSIKSDWVIYPNPVNAGEQITLRGIGISDESKISITDVTGRIVMSQLYKAGNEITINSSLLKGSGLYFLIITSGDETKMMKLIVK
jgi:uncharacterized protein YjdB